MAVLIGLAASRAMICGELLLPLAKQGGGLVEDLRALPRRQRLVVQRRLRSRDSPIHFCLAEQRHVAQTRARRRATTPATTGSPVTGLSRNRDGGDPVGGKRDAVAVGHDPSDASDANCAQHRAHWSLPYRPRRVRVGRAPLHGRGGPAPSCP